MAKEEAVGPVREGDVSVMVVFWDLGFRGADFRRLNRVRKFYCVAPTSDLVACDGRTVMDDLFSRTEGESTGHRFLIEQPESRDFCLWKRAVGLLCREGILLQEVGKYVQAPHMEWQWSSSMDRTKLYRQRLDGYEDRTDVFQLKEERVQTRSGGVYEWHHTRQGVREGERHATVVALDDQTVQLHSTTVKYVSQEEERSFLDTLRSYGDETW